MDYNYGNDWNQQNYQQPVFRRQPVFYNGVLNRTILNNESKYIFKQNYGNSLLAVLIPSLISGGIGAVFGLIPIVGIGVTSIVGWILGTVLGVGVCYFMLEIIRGNWQASCGDIFHAFDNFGNVLGTMIVTDIFIGLWSCLFIIPGIYKSYCWSMVGYIIADYPQMSGEQARELSTRMMEGHKWELFILQISFIGWFLLSVCTFGIFGIFYLNPWFSACMADYYDNLRMLYEAQMQQYNNYNYQQPQ